MDDRSRVKMYDGMIEGGTYIYSDCAHTQLGFVISIHRAGRQYCTVQRRRFILNVAGAVERLWRVGSLVNTIYHV